MEQDRFVGNGRAVLFLFSGSRTAVQPVTAASLGILNITLQLLYLMFLADYEWKYLITFGIE